ncbi:hypothetical protein EC988_004128 [Linderina pennispora]|nr:hypothetical protein EC988_004128 [Linderina pennispora]
MITRSSILALTAGLALLPAALGMYGAGSPVAELTPKNFEKTITKSQLPKFVKFYAPWCGHCKNLEPEYNKAARNAVGSAKFFAVNCDEDTNKPLCGEYNVQGFPTIKVFTGKRSKKGRLRSSDYNGERTASALVRHARDAVPNLSKHVTEDGLLAVLESAKRPTAVLLSERKKVASLWKGLSAQFAGKIDFSQVPAASQELMAKYGVKSLPAILMFTNPDTYDVFPDKTHWEPRTKFAAVAKWMQQVQGGKKPRKSLGSVDEIVSQKDLERLCIGPAGASPVPVVCVIGVVPLEPEYEESREDHAKTIQQLTSILNNQKLVTQHARVEDDDDEDGDDGDKEGERLPPLRVSWVNALSPVGMRIREMFGLSDDLPVVFAVDPRKSASALYRGAFEESEIQQWAEAAATGVGMRRFLFDLDVSEPKQSKERAKDEL